MLGCGKLDGRVIGGIACLLGTAFCVAAGPLGGIRRGNLGAAGGPPTVWAFLDTGSGIEFGQGHGATQWPRRRG